MLITTPPAGWLLRLFAAPALAAALAGCGTAPMKAPAADTARLNTAPPITSEQADDVTVYALGLVGTPYRYGGNTPDSGFDCSGLIGHVYRSRAGVAPPRSVAGLQYWGEPIGAGELRTGDLVIFGHSRATHAGIYVGGGRFVHAPSSGGKVRLDRLDSSYWARQNAAFRRP